MSNGRGVETPSTRFATAQAGLALALRFNSEVIEGRIRRTIYEREVSVYTGGAGVLIPKYLQGTTQDLRDGTFNFVILALGASALIADETLDEVFGKPHLDTEPSRQGLRVLVNQLRNAFAHNPWRPKWVVWPKFRSVHTVQLTGVTFGFNATALDGQGVRPEDVGGLERWLQVLKHCEQLVAHVA